MTRELTNIEDAAERPAADPYGALDLDRAPRTTIELYRRSCHVYADDVFLVEDDISLTYGQLFDRSIRLAASLSRLGVRRGDRVAHWMGNGTAWAVTKVGIELAGAVQVPLSAHLRTEDAAYALGQSGSKALVVGSPVDPTMLLGMIDPGSPNSVRSTSLPNLEFVVADGIESPLVESWDDLVAADPSMQLADLRQRGEETSPDDTVNILYTSGTTGRPKGAVITHGNVVANAAVGPGQLHRTREDRWLVALPLFHTFGCMMGFVYPLSIGASIVLLPKFSAGAALEAIERHRCTVLEGVPTMFSDILEHPSRAKFDLSSWQKLYVGGSYSTEPFLRKLHDELQVSELVTGFGMTEHAGLSLTTRPGDPLEVVSRTIGAPLPGAFEFAILDLVTGEPVPDGVEGEICARGPSVCLGYYEKPEETAAAFRHGGWMRSGDLGRIDPDSGYFQITGRCKEIIISGGENISPAEIEGLIARHEAIAEVHVCGVPDERMGEVPAAFVRVNEGCCITAEEIMHFCRERVASIKAPRHVFFRDEFPRTPTGKIQRFRLREIALDSVSAGREGS